MKAVTAAALAALLPFAAAAPAFAGDDGQASLISGLATTFGLTHEDDPHIDYRERGRIVLPPKKTLPPPASAVRADGQWPTNIETARDREEKKLEEGGPSARDLAHGQYVLVRPGDDVKVTTSEFDRNGQGCRRPDPKTGLCPDAPKASINWNPMTWVGLQKKPQVELGPEPERQNLVDPPKGYRSPAEGVGVKVDD